MIVCVEGDCCLPSSPFGPDLFRCSVGATFKSGESAEWHFAARAATAGRAPRSLCKKSAHRLNLSPRCPTLKCRLPLQALGFSNLSILWGWGGRFHHATGPASAGPLSRRGPPLCRRRARGVDDLAAFAKPTATASYERAEARRHQMCSRPGRAESGAEPLVRRQRSAADFWKPRSAIYAAFWLRRTAAFKGREGSIARSELRHRSGVAICIPGHPWSRRRWLWSAYPNCGNISPSSSGRILRKGL
jgi:hypothetical protein